MSDRAPDWLICDHSDIGWLPEYQEVARALDALAHRCEREGVAIRQRDFERAMMEVSRNLAAGDCCPECRADATITMPFLVQPREHGFVVCSYRCERGHIWHSSYASRSLIVSL